METKIDLISENVKLVNQITDYYFKFRKNFSALSKAEIRKDIEDYIKIALDHAEWKHALEEE